MSLFSRKVKKVVYPVVGRDPDIKLNIYGKNINGRIIIDYEKLKLENPKLYEKVLKDEHQSYLNDPYDVDTAVK